ncbi:hypothetical protein EB796_016585 [Bugula neritina]|uniref:Uncharacterized protein n=1 Tax=Bugula neritina TaxID=10212 RepID=A0A7J7JHU8_BUGNE|nr:hypothetical protein EB796_016585 [Bugula neritina]
MKLQLICVLHSLNKWWLKKYMILKTAGGKQWTTEYKRTMHDILFTIVALQNYRAIVVTKVNSSKVIHSFGRTGKFFQPITIIAGWHLII